MIYRCNLPKEVCECCSKFINIGQAITECVYCRKAIHTKCFKKTSFKVVNGKNYCTNCVQYVDTRYDPFLSLTSSRGTDSMHFYDEELTDTADIIRK